MSTILIKTISWLNSGQLVYFHLINGYRKMQRHDEIKIIPVPLSLNYIRDLNRRNEND